MTGRAAKYCKYELAKGVSWYGPEGKRDYKGRSPEEGKGLAIALHTRPADFSDCSQTP